MKKILILFLLLTPFVFNVQKAFAGVGQSAVVSPPAPVATAPIQRAVTANGDTVAIREIVKEKDPCEKCECYCKYYVLIVFIACPILIFIVIVLVLHRMAPRF